MGIKQIAKRIAYGPKADSQSYIVYLRSKGMRIGEDVTIYVPTKTTLMRHIRGWSVLEIMCELLRERLFSFTTIPGLF